MNYLKALALLYSILLLCSCSKDKTPLNNNNKIQLRHLSNSEEIIVEADHQFGFSLFKEILRDEPHKNVFISPLSVSYAFGMALNGADGETYEAITSVLELHGLDEDQINQSYLSLLELLTSIDPKVLFEIANSIWHRENFTVLPNFLEKNRTFLNAEVASLDFTDPGAVDTINDWVTAKTHGKIKEILDEIPADAVLYLINAIYFKAMWQYAFDKEYTTPNIFYSTPEIASSCQMMKVTADFKYYADSDVQIVELPYGKGNYSALLFLPNQNHNVNDIINSLDSQTWNYYQQNLKTGKGTVELPKLKLEYDLLMNDVLIRLGMGIAFSCSAGFSRINPDRPIAISRVIHKTFVQVDEEGTEAAAVTVIEIELTSTGGGSDLDFHIKINRPFLFIIHEKHSNTILFMGKIQQPEWSDSVFSEIS